MEQIIKNFNHLIKKTIFKVKNKTNNNLKISNFNKFLITLVVSLFIYLFYLLIPLLYDKTWIQTNIESKLFNEFNINLSTSADISYRILPAPHFLIKDSRILVNYDEKQKSIAEIKFFKVFVSQSNFIDKEKMDIKKIVINEANFSLIRSDIKIVNEFSNNQFSNKKIRINNSNIFFKDNYDEIITIIKINKAILFFDGEKLLNLFNLEGNAFGTSFIFDFKNKNSPIINKIINFKAKSLKLNIFNKHIIKNNTPNTGSNTISFLNSTLKTNYNVKEEQIAFESSKSRLNNSIIEYSGVLSTNPFDLNLNVNLGIYKISQLFSLNPIFKELIKSKLLFNEKLSLDLSIDAKTNAQKEIFQNAKIYFKIINGKLNFDKTIFVNNNIGQLELTNSNLFFENNELILNTNILITIKDHNKLFSALNTNKKLRKEIKNIFINLDYDFLTNQIKFNKINIDNNEVSDQFLNAMDDFNDNNLNNVVKSRGLINKLFKIYKG